MKRLLIFAGIFLIIHGLIEIAGLFPLLSPSYQPHFIFTELTQNWRLVVWIGALAGLLRLIAAIGLFVNRKWAWALGVVLSIITFTMLTFYLPFGVMDALLASVVLLLLIIAHYGKAKII